MIMGGARCRRPGKWVTMALRRAHGRADDGTTPAEPTRRVVASTSDRVVTTEVDGEDAPTPATSARRLLSRRRSAGPADEGRPSTTRALGRALVAVTAGIVGTLGALAPAMAGHESGDPDTVIFWVGLALGSVGATVAGIAAVIVLSRAAAPRLATIGGLVALVLAGIAALSTVALILSA
jgi:hypothetical protein